MVDSLILTTIKKTWDAWNIRGFVLISLALQVFLFLFSPLRKRTKTSIISWSLWLAYLVADYVATFCIGLIFNKREDISSGSIKNYILVFWAPFLLLHLGGPNTITAFALEDNELWLRHLLGLAFQGITVVYVFFLTIPGNVLWIPTVLVFVAGMIKYVERILSLYLASMDTLRKSVVHQKPNGPESPDLADLSEELSKDPDVELVRKGFLCFNKFKGLVVDMTYSYNDRNKCRGFFLKTTRDDALTIIEAELGFMYEFFFTKETVLQSKVGCFPRFASISSIVVAFIVFFNISDKKQHGFSMFEIRATYILFCGAVAQDIMALLMLAFSDRIAIFWNSNESHGSSNKVIIHLNNFIAKVSKAFLKLRKPKWSNCKKGPYATLEALSTPQLFRRWCGKIPAYDFLIHCIYKGCKQMLNELWSEVDVFEVDAWTCIKVIEVAWTCIQFIFVTILLCLVNIMSQVQRWIFAAKNPLPQKLWAFIFLELQRKSEEVGENEEIVKKICEERGAWTIRGEGMLDELLVYVEKIAFDEALIVWHIATILCYYVEEVSSDTSVDSNLITNVFCYNPEVHNPNTSDEFNASDYRHFSKLLSDYMMYLLVKETSVMSAVAGIGQKRILEILIFLVKTNKAILEKDKEKEVPSYSVAKLLLCECLVEDEIKRQSDNKIYMTLINAFHDAKNSGDKLLIDGCELAKKLLSKSMRWKIIAQVWVEMMSFAAINCRPDAHVQQLSKGGQLLSLVWLLTIHFGLASRQFQVQKIDNYPNMNEKERQQPITCEATQLEITSSCLNE